MRPTISLGRIAGIRIGVHWSVFAMMVLVTEIVALSILPPAAPRLPVLVYWLAGLVAAVTFLASLLAHELAHALVARHYGMPADRITLWLLGGLTELGSNPPTPRAAFLVAGAGPATSIFLGGIFGLLAGASSLLPLPPVAVAALTWLALVNAILGVFNLLPGAPLDGGRILQAALWKRSGDRSQATVSAAKAGRIVGLVLISLGILEVLTTRLLSGIWLALIGWFLTMSAATEETSASLHERLQGVRMRDVMSPTPVTAPSWWTADTFVDRIAQQDRHRIFPVVDMEGRPVSVVSLADLTHLRPDLRATTKIIDAVRPTRNLAIAAPEDLLTELPPTAWPRADKSLLLVVQAHHLVGVVTARDITRAMELASLDHPPHAADRSAPTSSS
ncbi:site-2 protease family protein [Actinopolymorpha alba]|uniref:site-2 protease family protein n=1 Tax=Actinopolymorpha alba TaxID=533267 RepID=UPI000374A7D8|nr:site-2 protease family protein [Actinopolymorpha alba]